MNDLEVVKVQRSTISNHPEYYNKVLIVQHGWKNTHTGEVAWGETEIRKVVEDE